ncbi:MAG TPA: S46 family peptidase [Pyrinomonadaceae bacterium]|nr:S46 family peptidase [Pyrinomonadaceae bacterium]
MKPTTFMNRSLLLCALIVALFVFQTIPVAAFDEGMWTFNNVPREDIKQKYGFEVTDEWLHKVQLASVRFPGGSGSFVSPNGLVLTNYHIVEDVIGELSSATKDYAKEGFVARNQSEELKAEGVSLDQLISIEDVTARVNGVVKDNMSAAEANAARRTEINAIESESARPPDMRGDVVTLYQGGLYNLYRYKKYSDVRIVFVPEFQAAFFGGDPDNFNFPRFNLDMALVRVYENDQPLKVENYFKWSKTGVKDGDLVFVTGHPGATQRLNTVAHLESLRDVSISLLLRVLESRQKSLKQYMALGEEQTRRAQNELNSVENSIKVYKGQVAGLRDPNLMAKKRRAEQSLRNSINADSMKQKEYGDAWTAIAKGRKDIATYERDRRFLDPSSTATGSVALPAGFNTTLFAYARALVRLADENQKPDAQRLPEFMNTRRAALEAALYSTAPIYDDFEKIKLAGSLALMQNEYGANSSLVKKVLKGKTPEARAAELIEGSKLKDVEYRKQVATAGTRMINSGPNDSKDPMIELARDIDKESRAVRQRYEQEVVAVERTNYAKIAHALFADQGTKLYPDATFTLRLSYGAVKGYRENGKFVSPFTTIGGLFARSNQYHHAFPYNLPPRWTSRRAALNPRTPFNFVSDNDIVGGNSGSPAINKNAELVGLIFDGNIQSLVGNFEFDDSVNRAISVDSRGMLEVMRKVFNADNIVNELLKG